MYDSRTKSEPVSMAMSLAILGHRIGRVDGLDRAPVTRTGQAGGQRPHREQGAGAAGIVAASFPTIPVAVAQS